MRKTATGGCGGLRHSPCNNKKIYLELKGKFHPKTFGIVWYLFDKSIVDICFACQKSGFQDM
jgi:hypothetical protein